MHKIAFTASIGHGLASTSRSRGTFKLTSPDSIMCAVMLARASALGSVGCHINSGIDRARVAAWYPEPDAISSTVSPTANSFKKTLVKALVIGSALRKAAGDTCFWNLGRFLAIL